MERSHAGGALRHGRQHTGPPAGRAAHRRQLNAAASWRSRGRSRRATAQLQPPRGRRRPAGRRACRLWARRQQPVSHCGPHRLIRSKAEPLLLQLLLPRCALPLRFGRQLRVAEVAGVPARVKAAAALLVVIVLAVAAPGRSGKAEAGGAAALQAPPAAAHARARVEDYHQREQRAGGEDGHEDGEAAAAGAVQGGAAVLAGAGRQRGDQKGIPGWVGWDGMGWRRWGWEAGWRRRETAAARCSVCSTVARPGSSLGHSCCQQPPTAFFFLYRALA